MGPSSMMLEGGGASRQRCFVLDLARRNFRSLDCRPPNSTPQFKGFVCVGHEQNHVKCSVSLFDDLNVTGKNRSTTLCDETFMISKLPQLPH